MDDFESNGALGGGPVPLAEVLRPIVARVVAAVLPAREAAAMVALIFAPQRRPERA